MAKIYTLPGFLDHARDEAAEFLRPLNLREVWKSVSYVDVAVGVDLDASWRHCALNFRAAWPRGWFSPADYLARQRRACDHHGDDARGVAGVCRPPTTVYAWTPPPPPPTCSWDDWTPSVADAFYFTVVMTCAALIVVVVDELRSSSPQPAPVQPPAPQELQGPTPPRCVALRRPRCSRTARRS